MVSVTRIIDEADPQLNSLVEEAARNGHGEVSDSKGNSYLIEQREPPRRGGPLPGEKISEWLKRTLPSGEGIDISWVRNPEGSQGRDAWIVDMLDEDADERDADLASKAEDGVLTA